MDYLKQYLINIWEDQIKTAYANGKICSERHLQCELYHHLKTSDKYDVWVEPTLSVSNDSTFTTMKPDLLISKGSEMIAMMEIKNVPDMEASYKADIQKLVNFERSKTAEYFLHLDTSTGHFRREKS